MRLSVAFIKPDRLYLCIILLFIIIIANLISSGCNSEKEDRSKQKDSKEMVYKDGEVITIASGPLSGIYYPIGHGIAKALDENLDDQISVLSTGASGENINLMTADKIELSITMADAVRQAYEGFGAYSGEEPKEELRGLATLYPNFVQVVTVESSNINSFEDIKGKKVGVGAPGSGVELNARLMLEAHGMDYMDIDEKYLDYAEAIEHIRSKEIDVAFVTSGIPNPTVRDLSNSDDIVIVPIEGEGMNNLKEQYPFFTENKIPKGTYNNEEDITTATISNLLLVNKSLSTDKVYRITESLIKNIDELQNAHEAAEKYINKDSLSEDMVVPFHPGAKEFYQNKGLLKK